jgi:hypothetical protein
MRDVKYTHTMGCVAPEEKKMCANGNSECIPTTIGKKTMSSYTKIIKVFSMARQIVEGFLP